MSAAPLYSFVATSRNDDHGGDILRRTQSWVTRLAEQCERHRLPCELVLIDWNPPQTRAPLADVLAWPAGSEWFSARVLVVPPRLHRELRYSSRLAMFQMIAKNVGIRRSLGEFIIATNVDIIFSDEMFRWLKTDKPRPGHLYRSDRWDIPNEIQLQPELDLLLQRAQQEAIRRNLRDGTYVKRDGEFTNTTQTQFDFSFYNPLKHKIDNLHDMIENGVPSAESVREKLKEILETMPNLRDNFFIPMLHTNGCGDFTMLSREDWFGLRGYPEWNVFSWAIDSAIVFQAHYNGLEIHELAAEVVHYHIEHDYGSGWTPEGSGNLWARLDQQGIPYLSYDDFIAVVKELQGNAARGFSTVYNELDWGYFDREIECRQIVAQGTPARLPQARNTGPLKEALELECLVEVPLERLYTHNSVAVRSELREEDGGERQIAVKTAPEQWSYSLALDIADLEEQTHDCWLAVDIRVDVGTVFIGVLNRDRTDFVLQAECRGPDRGFVEVRSFIRSTSRVSEVVFRNGRADGPAEFAVRAVRILREPDGALADADPRTRAEPQHDGAVAGEWGEALAAIATLPDNSKTRHLGSWRIAQLVANSPDVIVRVLPDLRPGEPNGQRACQAMIILPAGSAGAVVDLGVAEQVLQKVIVELQVIEGEAAIALQAPMDGPVLLEHREPIGPPLTRVEMAPPDMIGSLLLRNPSATDRTKVLLHSIEWQTAG